MVISDFFILLLAVMACSQVSFVKGHWKCPTDECQIKYKAVGCYKDDGHRPLPTEILNERDKTSKVYGGRLIDWHDWDNYIEGFACRCAAIAKKKGYSVFGLQFYGECWSGPGLDTYKKVGKAHDNDCVGLQYKPCNKFSRHCVGKSYKNFVYEIVPDCDIPLENLGCFADNHQEGARPLPQYYLTDRDRTRKDIYSGKTIDWRNWDVYMPELVCRCAKKAKQLGRTTFGVQYYGECWTGEQGDSTYYKDGATGRCIDKCYKPCKPYQEYCAGKQYANNVYRLADAACELKTIPKGCYKKAAGAFATYALLLDETDPKSLAFKGELLSIRKWDSEFPKFLCRCAREARTRGFWTFVVFRKGICFGSHGHQGAYYNANDKLKSSKCYKGKKECPSNSEQCAGGEKSIFVYQITKPNKVKVKSDSFIPQFKEDELSVDDPLLDN